MDEQRLIDANAVEAGFDELCQSPYFKNDVSAKHGAETLMDLCVRSDSHKPNTIDPETLPIVRQLREENARLNRGISNLSENVKSAYEQRDEIQKELARVTAERDAAVNDANNARQSLMMAMFAKCEFLVKFDSFGKSVQIVRRTDEEGANDVK